MNAHKFPENSILDLKRLGILYVLYGLKSFYVNFLVTAITALSDI
jgi:hypothetical protein